MCENPNYASFNLDDVEDSETEAWAGISQGLVSLSEATEAPDGIDVLPGLVVNGEFDFNSDDWVSKVNGVRGWLRIGELSTASRSAFLQDLVRELNLEGEAVELVDGSPRLSLNAVQVLRDRVEAAVRHQLDFQTELDNGATPATATKSWKQAWEDDLDDVQEPSVPEPVKARTDVYHIAQITKMKIDLAPSYQRGDVWTNADRSALIESILRGIPLPSVILRKSPNSSLHEVVDGKQRLTAIFRFVGKHPIAMRIVNDAEKKYPGAKLRALFETDYPKFKRVWKNVVGETLNAQLEDRYYFPFKLRSGQSSTLAYEPLSQFRGKYFTQIASLSLGEEMVEDLFEGGPEYKIPVIVYTSAEPRQIHEVFKLYNKQGVHLNAEEIRNAVYHDVELTRAILLAAGDADAHLESEAVAPSIAAVPHLTQIAQDLSSYGLREARYRRSKVLGWLIATLIQDPQGNFPSTSAHTNRMLESIQNDPKHKLREAVTLADLFTWLAQTIHVHASHDELWADTFKGGSVKWNDLQLVGSLVGVALSTLMRPEDIDDLLDDHADEILEASASAAWRRPDKTQTKEQWAYIARIAVYLLEILNIDSADASSRVREHFGSSGFDKLISLVTVAEA